MDEVTKALGPWPILQLMFGVTILALGVLAVVRGFKGKEGTSSSSENQRAVWLAFEHIKNIEENSFKFLELQKETLDAIKTLSSVLWNREQR